jgi:GTP-binding protein
LTKTDKLNTAQQARQLTLVSAITGISKDQVILFSAKTRTGKDRIWDAVERICHAATL